MSEPKIEKQTNIAMILTLSRLVISPIFAYLFFMESFGARLLTFLLVVLSELSDFFDGYIARKRNEVTDLGKVLDPLADSLTHITIFLCFTWEHMIPLYMILIILYRESIVATLRTVCAFRSVVVSARTSGKIKTGFMAAGILFILLLRVFESLGLHVAYGGIYYGVFAVITVVTFWSAIDYIMANAKHISLS